MSARSIGRRAFIAGSATLCAAASLPAGAFAPTALHERADDRPIVPRPTVTDLANDPASAARIRRAYANMFAWSKEHADDPRSWPQQASIHSRAAARGETDPDYLIHGSYYFFPWHRAYLYFHERILAWHLTERTALDSTLRLPVWNWDADSTGLSDPTLYTAKTDASGAPNPLLHERTFRYFEPGDTKPFSALTFTGRDFFGYPPALDASNNGAVENGVHANVHVDMGGDMGSIHTAANDPVFFAHHANIDKIWAWWSSLSGAKATPSPGDWDRVVWTFTDWDGSVVAVRPADVRHHETALRYSYARPESPLTGPEGATDYALLHSHARWYAPAEVRARVLAASRVSLKCLNIAVPGPGRYGIGAILPGETQTQVLGWFTVFIHHGVKRANAFLDVSDARATLLHPNGVRLALLGPGVTELAVKTAILHIR
jgi:hypothetical protein